MVLLTDSEKRALDANTATRIQTVKSVCSRTGCAPHEALAAIYAHAPDHTDEPAGAPDEATLTAELVSKLMLEALSPTETGVTVKGIVHSFCFTESAREPTRAILRSLLPQLPASFLVGGGHSFLEMAITRDGRHWAEHLTMESLCALALFTGQGRWTFPRDFWSALPGGMPYVEFNVDSWRAHLADIQGIQVLGTLTATTR